MATELAKAYVQIIPSARGIQGSLTQALGGEASSAGASAGQSFGSQLVRTALGAISVAAIGKALGATITEGAALEQSIGGIETLFKDSADTVKAYADEAYRTAGMSANQYMEQTTSFAASLLQSLGGDTAAAAEVANMAMVDMSDNANKMGTDMERITDAYQGFAKQNYTMLDNLKLGSAAWPTCTMPSTSSRGNWTSPAPPPKKPPPPCPVLSIPWWPPAKTCWASWPWGRISAPRWKH